MRKKNPVKALHVQDTRYGKKKGTVRIKREKKPKKPKNKEVVVGSIVYVSALRKLLGPVIRWRMSLQWFVYCLILLTNPNIS